MDPFSLYLRDKKQPDVAYFFALFLLTLQ